MKKERGRLVSFVVTPEIALLLEELKKQKPARKMSKALRVSVQLLGAFAGLYPPREAVESLREFVGDDDLLYMTLSTFVSYFQSSKRKASPEKPAESSPKRLLPYLIALIRYLAAQLNYGVAELEELANQINPQDEKEV